MNLYICTECGKVFENPVTVPGSETYGFDGAMLASPCCQAPFIEAARCVCCGEPTEVGYNCGLCKDCARAALSDFNTFLRGHFNEAEREYLNCVYDGVPLTKEVEYDP